MHEGATRETLDVQSLSFSLHNPLKFGGWRIKTLVKKYKNTYRFAILAPSLFSTLTVLSPP